MARKQADGGPESPPSVGDNRRRTVTGCGEHSTPEPIRGVFIRLEQHVFRDVKTWRAARDLGVPIPQLVGHLASLWCWAVEELGHGDVDGLDALDVAHAAAWPVDDAERFYDVLLARGWIKDDGHLAGFERANGYFLRERARKRRAARAPKPEPKPEPKIPSRQTPKRKTTKSTRSAAKTTKHTTDGAVDALLDQYALATGYKIMARTRKMFRDQIRKKPSLFPIVEGATREYIDELLANPPERKALIIRPYNWFGREQKWESWDRSGHSDTSGPLVPPASSPKGRRSARDHDPKWVGDRRDRASEERRKMIAKKYPGLRGAALTSAMRANGDL